MKEITIDDIFDNIRDDISDDGVSGDIMYAQDSWGIDIDDVMRDEVWPKFIENPLPMPKRREHKEMDYAMEVDEADDYDITDMSGKDFFDIE